MKLNSIGRWEIYGGIDRARTIELTAGDLVYVEVDGHDHLQPTRIEFNGAARCYVSVDSFPLWDGMRAELDRR